MVKVRSTSNPEVGKEFRGFKLFIGKRFTSGIGTDVEVGCG